MLFRNFLNKINDFMTQWSQLTELNKLPTLNNRIIFYGEDSSSFIHYSGLITILTHKYKHEIIYLTSSRNDPILSSKNNFIKSFYIGYGAIRTYIFNHIAAKIFIMTMPELDIYHIKRSKFVSKYIYVFHSPVSTHMIYNEGAFDHYDIIFCVGRHHIAEIRERERRYNLPKKELIKYGYPLIQLLESKNNNVVQDQNNETVLIAPSWGDQGILESEGTNIINTLLDSNFKVVIRPHPQTQRLRPDIICNLKNIYLNNRRVHFESGIENHDSLLNSYVLITDWSGISFEYAIGLNKPVIFIDVPRKVKNKNYIHYTNIPIEISAREYIGIIIQPNDIHKIPHIINDMKNGVYLFRLEIQNIRNKILFNFENPDEYGALYINNLMDENK